MTKRPAPMPPSWVLVVDDDIDALRSTEFALLSSGIESVHTCADARQVDEVLAARDVAVVILDLAMPHVRGEVVLASIVGRDADLPVIVVTGEGEVESAVRCMKLGATDFLVKPVDSDRLIATVLQAREQRALRYQNKRLREGYLADRVEAPEAFSELVTVHPKMLRIFGYLDAISRSSDPVLVRGETGTGKELLARSLHVASGRPGRFVAVNVAAIERPMIDAALFGHERGAFTGADKEREGFLANADGGTLFLDEIGDLTDECQVKLLRVIQEREYYPVGSTRRREMRARIVAATLKDRSELRQDLVHRLETHRVVVPPLRERLSDLGVLVDHLLDVASAKFGKKKPTVPSELFGYLENYSFPGNVRELRNMVFDAVAQHHHGVLSMSAFLDRILPSEGSSDEQRPTARPEEIIFPHPLPRLDEVIDAAIAEALRRTGGNHSAAARFLGVARQTIGRRAPRAESAGTSTAEVRATADDEP